MEYKDLTLEKLKEDMSDKNISLDALEIFLDYYQKILPVGVYDKKVIFERLMESTADEFLDGFDYDFYDLINLPAFYEGKITLKDYLATNPDLERTNILVEKLLDTYPDLIDKELGTFDFNPKYNDIDIERYLDDFELNRYLRDIDFVPDVSDKEKVLIVKEFANSYTDIFGITKDNKLVYLSFKI